MRTTIAGLGAATLLVAASGLTPAAAMPIQPAAMSVGEAADNYVEVQYRRRYVRPYRYARPRYYAPYYGNGYSYGGYPYGGYPYGGYRYGGYPYGYGYGGPSIQLGPFGFRAW